MRNKTLIDELVEILEKEERNFLYEKRNLVNVYDKLQNLGIELNSQYSIPLKDTIGKTFSEQTKFKNIL